MVHGWRRSCNSIAWQGWGGAKDRVRSSSREAEQIRFQIQTYASFKNISGRARPAFSAHSAGSIEAARANVEGMGTAMWIYGLMAIGMAMLWGLVGMAVLKLLVMIGEISSSAVIVIVMAASYLLGAELSARRGL
jgi:hypothetical protein